MSAKRKKRSIVITRTGCEIRKIRGTGVILGE